MNLKSLLFGTLFCLLLAGCGDDNETKTDGSGTKTGSPLFDHFSRQQCLVKSWFAHYRGYNAQGGWTRTIICYDTKEACEKTYGSYRVSRSVWPSEAAKPDGELRNWNVKLEFDGQEDRAAQLTNCNVHFAKDKEAIVPIVEPIAFNVEAPTAGDSERLFSIQVRWGCYASCDRLKAKP